MDVHVCNLGRVSAVKMFFGSSGGDDADVEQTGQLILCPSVDHHPGCARWAALTRPAHIFPIQGK